jgi:hypothetical protein
MEIDRRQAVLVARWWPDTADLTIAPIWAGRPWLGCRPFLRVRHMVCFGHSQAGSLKYSASPDAGGPRR